MQHRTAYIVHIVRIQSNQYTGLVAIYLVIKRFFFFLSLEFKHEVVSVGGICLWKSGERLRVSH